MSSVAGERAVEDIGSEPTLSPMAVLQRDSVDVMATELVGMLALQGDCLVFSEASYPVVAPAGAEWSEEMSGVRLISGELIPLATSVVGAGGVFEQAQFLQSIAPRLEFRGSESCFHGTSPVAVFDTMAVSN